MLQWTGWFLFAFPSAAAALVARFWSARALGMRGIRFFGGAIDNPGTVAAWRQAVVVLAALAASYLVPTLAFALAGRSVATTVVTVLPGRPAAAGGMVSGDRVTSIAGSPIASWNDLAGTVQRHPSEPVEIVVVRGGEEQHLTITTGDNGKIGVTPEMKWERVGAGEALAKPATVIADQVRGWVDFVAGHATGEMAGPAAIVSETSRAGSTGTSPLLFLVGVFLAMGWPLSALITLAMVPRRARIRAPGPRAPS